MCATVHATAFDVTDLDRRPGQITCQISGKGALAAFKNEAGGHRIQHVPDHDKRGRMHTSNLTVAVLAEPTEVELHLDPRDLEISTCRGSGAGGQHRNKTDSAVQIKHLPSGVMVRCESERSQAQNKDSALSLLRSRLWEAKKQGVTAQRAQDRRDQVGTGQRADKRRSYYFQRDLVVDHVLGREWRLKAFMRGDWD
jgi:peptide chain release factor 1